MQPRLPRCFLLLMLALFWPFAVQAQGFADEERDWGIAPSAALRRAPYTAPTPREIPGAATVGTGQLQAMLASAQPPLLIDVLSSTGHLSLPGAIWIGGAGRGSNFFDPVQAEYGEVLERVTKGDKNRALAFFCASVQCWLSYNAALRASALGYTRVYWYRGGIASWHAAGLPLETLSER